MSIPGGGTHTHTPPHTPPTPAVPRGPLPAQGPACLHRGRRRPEAAGAAGGAGGGAGQGGRGGRQVAVLPRPEQAGLGWAGPGWAARPARTASPARSCLICQPCLLLHPRQPWRRGAPSSPRQGLGLAWLPPTPRNSRTVPTALEKQPVPPPSPGTAVPVPPLQLMPCLTRRQPWVRESQSLSPVGAVGTGSPLVPAPLAVHG